MLEIITREEWGAREPKSTPGTISVPSPELWLHHTAGANIEGDDAMSDQDLRRVKSTQNFHMDVRGWNDIAYSFLLDPDGYVFEGRGAGIRGGHTKNHNTVSHGICVMGNYNNSQVDEDLLPRLAELVRYGADQGWWPRGFTGGHRDTRGGDEQDCPGANLYPMLPEINRLVLEGEDMPTAEEIAKAVWEHRTRSGITSSLALDRNYRNISELISAHRLGALGTTALADLDDEDFDQIAKVVNDEFARRQAN